MEIGHKRGKDNVTTEAQIRVLQSQSKGCLQPPGAGTGSEQIVPRGSQRDPGLPLTSTDFRLLVSGQTF